MPNSTSEFMLGLLLAAVLVFSDTSAVPAADGSPVDAFKDFLSRPPSIREISFAHVRCGVSNAAQFYAGAASGSNFFLREYTADEDVHRLLSPTNLMKIPYFLGSVGPKQWEIAALTVEESEEPGSILSFRADNGRGILDAALAFGLAGRKAGSFVWQSNRFLAKRFGPIPLGGWSTEAHGEITVSNGYPVKLDCEDLTVYYDYSNGLLPLGVPGTIIRCGRGRPQSDCFMEMHILSLVPDPNLEEYHFQPYRHIDPQYLGIVRTVGTNRQVLKDNTFAVSRPAVLELQKRNSRRRLLVLAVFVASASLAPIIYHRFVRRPAST